MKTNLPETSTELERRSPSPGVSGYLSGAPHGIIASGSEPDILVAVLFARKDSIYKTLPNVDVYDAERNALNWPGGSPVVAHPPCRAWGGLRHMAKPKEGERDLAIWAVEQVRRWGGVLEHPAASVLWKECSLPEPRYRDAWNGWTLAIPQMWWGHRAEKPTRLYIVGCEPDAIPEIPLKLGDAECVFTYSHKCRSRPQIRSTERESTPRRFAEFLVALARRTGAVAPALLRDNVQAQ